MDINKLYKFHTVIGSGSFGTVRTATPTGAPDQWYAVKTVKKLNLSNEDLEYMKTEIEILMKVDHPNIVKYYGTYEDLNNLNIVMELCTGGTL